MRKIRISAVSYTNTKPFIYGLQHSNILDYAELSLDNPSDCAQKLIDDLADVGLVPVAALPDIPDYQIISNYCIGAVTAVNSVFLFSDMPVEQIQTLRLDKQSRTSNLLARILLENHWKKELHLTEDEADAFIEIGDRTFGKKNKYRYAYDLAEEWIKFTGLPFVFAVWAANKPVEEQFILDFNSALELGLKNRKRVIEQLPVKNDFDLDDYLMNRIDYTFDENKYKALNLFLKLIKAL